MAMGVHDCKSVEEARKMYPQLDKVPATKVQFLDGILVLFHEAPLDNDDLGFLSSMTKTEFISIYLNPHTRIDKEKK